MDTATLQGILKTLQAQQEVLAQQVAAIEKEISKRSGAGTLPALPAPHTLPVKRRVVPAPEGVNLGGRPRMYDGCQVEGCDGKHAARGYCTKHYAQIQRAQKSQSRAKLGAS